MTRPTQALLERADELARRMDGLPGVEPDRSLEERLAGASEATLVEPAWRAGAEVRLADTITARVAAEIARRLGRPAGAADE